MPARDEIRLEKMGNAFRSFLAVDIGLER